MRDIKNMEDLRIAVPDFSYFTDLVKQRIPNATIVPLTSVDKYFAGDVEADGECDTENVTALADEMIVYTKNAPGTHLYVAVKAIAVGDVCHSVAAGKVTDAAGVAPVCRAVTLAAADDDIFEGIPMTGDQDTDT